MHHAATPAWQDMLPQQPFGFLCRARTVRAFNVTVEKLLNDAVDAVGFGCTGCNLLAARVAPFGDRTQRLARKSAGGLQVNLRITPDGELARLAVMPISRAPRFRA
jgi:hypothetical protein